MCELRRDGKCYASERFGRRCFIVRTWFCSHADRIRQRRLDIQSKIERENIDRRELGVGS